MVIEVRVVQFWSEIILVISNQTRAARSFDFEMHFDRFPGQVPINLLKYYKNLKLEECS